MKAKLFYTALVSMFCMGVAVAEEYTYQALYWRVDDTVSYYGSPAYASLYAVVNGDKIGYHVGAEEIAKAGTGTFTPFVGEGSDGWNWGSLNIQDATFYVELWSDFGENEDPTVLATSYGAAYALLTSYMDRNTSGMPSPGSAISNYTFSFVIPEPTSAVLMLLGVAGLALKRKRRG